jgi:hypothetical protein
MIIFAPDLAVGVSSAILTSGFGEWRSLEARVVRVDEAGGSNPLSPTLKRSAVRLTFFHWLSADFLSLEISQRDK